MPGKSKCALSLMTAVMLVMVFAVGPYAFANEKNVRLEDESSIPELLKVMTLEEKALLLAGDWDSQKLKGAAGSTTGDLYEKYGIPATSLPDGPAGVRIDPLPGGTAPDGTPLTRYATQFPNASARASTWNLDLLNKVGRSIGKELRYFGGDLWLAPAMNIHRHPLNGRNFEYYSEDPLLSGKASAAEVKGLQSQRVGATIKHFAANNQENSRRNLPTNVSQRALREIYLRGFEIAVKEAKPWAIMTAYNQINGVSPPQNPELITTIARKEWGFDGIVMTDWGGQGNASYWEPQPGNNAYSSMVKAGTDLSMPSGSPEAIIEGYQKGFLTMEEIDAAVARILKYVLKTPAFEGVQPSTDHNKYAEENEQVAYDTAVEGMVILKNEKVKGKKALPITGGTIGTIGNATNNLVRGGAGSGNVNVDPSKLVHLAQALKEEGAKVIDATEFDYPQVDSILPVGGLGGDPAFKEMKPSKEQLAKDIVDKSDSVIMTIRRGSAEGVDVQAEKGAYYLSDAEQYLIDTASELCRKAKKPFIVVLSTGAPIEMESWKDKTDAILLAWETGTVLGKPIAAVLTGKENPSGKLSTTFPIDIKGKAPNGRPYVPSTTFGENPVTYHEGIYVGYRYYDTFNVPVSYEFGYGKNYSDFSYSKPKLSSKKFNQSIKVSVDVKNTSNVPGKEVVQVYVGAPGKALHKPVKELKAFGKTRELGKNERQTLTFTLDARSLASFDEKRSAWVVEPGKYTVYIGASSKDIKHTLHFTVDKEILVEKVNDVLKPVTDIGEIVPPKKNK